jgi:shikimate kinase
MTDNIVLIGMPGAGKSTVGVVLAKTLGYDFIDTDIVLSRRLGSTLQAYIDAKGIDAFLMAEEKTALTLSCAHTVIATGGSMVLSDRAMTHLKQNSTVVFLDVSLPELEKRLENIKTRGVALRPGQTIADIYRERRPLYLKYADIIISDDAGAGTLEDAVARIVANLGEHAPRTGLEK